MDGDRGVTTRLPAMIATTGLGALGGAVFHVLSMPLPWMLGALVLTLIGALAGLPLVSPERVRTLVIAVIGVLLGASFSPDVLGNIGQWAISLGFLAIYLVIAAGLVVPFYIFVGRMQPVTAFFSAMPGGLTEMMLMGKSMGGDDRQIVLSHAARITITIGAIALWFRLGLGLEVSGVSSLSGDKGALGALDVAILTACGVAGVYLGRWLRLPAAGLLGPMLLSAAVHVTGMTTSAPPALLVILAQVLLGTIMGCRFLGCPTALVLRALALSLGATVLTLGVALGFAVAFHDLFDQSIEQVILAFAPGGLTEMSLVALSMGEDVAYISLHHVARITILLALAPVVLKGLARWLRQQG